MKPRNQPFVILLEPYSIQISSTGVRYIGVPTHGILYQIAVNKASEWNIHLNFHSNTNWLLTGKYETYTHIM
ncbi:hypothetical protein VNO78_03125 [Psophocarpus tetragonolobus]|uniref:Uncharacterized protein n=1 Tax=Psophocarpus tetragonolobus TaxID=3891 RepID=A0AAN9T3T2_PSOTE